MSSEATNAQSTTVPDTHVQNAILSTDIPKIKKDAESAIIEDIKKSKSVLHSLIISDGTIYGAAYNGTVYLNKNVLNPESPLHEYIHLWVKAMKQHNPEGWQSVKNLLKGTPVWDEVVNDSFYSDIKDDEDAVAGEALSRISGKPNAARMEAEAQKMIDETEGILEKTEAITLLQRMKDALNKFWNWVGKELFGIKKFDSIEEITDRVLYDLLHGTQLNVKSDGKMEFHFIGEKGAYNLNRAEEAFTRLDNLDVVRQMEKDEEDPLNIKMATGWERGADGKWHYEIHDFDKFNYLGNLEWESRHPEVNRMHELNIKQMNASIFGKEPLTEAEQHELAEVKKKVENYDLSKMQKNPNKLKLLDFVQDDDLYAAYPYLKQTWVSFSVLVLQLVRL